MDAPVPDPSNSTSVAAELDAYLHLDASAKSQWTTEQYRALWDRVYHASRRHTFTPALESILRLFTDLQQSYRDTPALAQTSDFHPLLHFLVVYRRPAGELYKVMEQMQQWNRRGAHLQLDQQTIYELIQGLTNLGELSKALNMLQYAHRKEIPLTTVSYSILVRGFLKRGAIALKGMSAARRSASLRNHPDFVAATNIAMMMIQRGVKMDTNFIKTFMYSYNALVDDVGCRYWLSMAERLPQIQLTPLYNLLVDTYCKMGDIRSALALVQQMKESSNKDRLWPNSFTYGSLMQAALSKNDSTLVRSHDKIQPIALLMEMKRLGIPYDIHNWNVILWNHAKKGLVHQVEQYWAKCREMDKQLKPNVLTFNSLIIAQATAVDIHAGRSADCLEIMSGRYMAVPKQRFRFQMGSQDPKEVLLIALQKSQHYFESLKKAGLTPNAKTINTMLHLLIRNRQPTAAFQLMATMEKEYLQRTDVLLEQKRQQESADYILRRHQELSAMRAKALEEKKLRKTTGEESGTARAASAPTENRDNMNLMTASVTPPPRGHDLSNPKAVVDTTTFNTLIALHLNARDFSSAWDLLSHTMPQYAVHPDEWTYTLLLRRARETVQEDIVEKCIQELMRVRRERGSLLGGFVFKGGPLERELYLLLQLHEDTKARLALSEETIASVKWLQSTQRLPSEVFHQTQNRLRARLLEEQQQHQELDVQEEGEKE